MRRWGKRHLGAGCLGVLLGVATVVWFEVRWIKADMEHIDQIKRNALARALYEGPSQAEFDQYCAGEKRNLDAARRSACARMEFYMNKARERRAAEAKRAADPSRKTQKQEGPAR
jgi:hypothetical protein